MNTRQNSYLAGSQSTLLSASITAGALSCQRPDIACKSGRVPANLRKVQKRSGKKQSMGVVRICDNAKLQMSMNDEFVVIDYVPYMSI
jgi:hypothetical protein